VLAVLLLSDVFAELALGRKKPAVYNLESLIVFRLGQRILPQAFLERVR
jgi:hypothetical protein